MNKILQGDSLELLKSLDDNSVDNIVTDPSYGYSLLNHPPNTPPNIKKSSRIRGGVFESFILLDKLTFKL